VREVPDFGRYMKKYRLKVIRSMVIYAKVDLFSSHVEPWAIFWQEEGAQHGDRHNTRYRCAWNGIGHDSTRNDSTRRYLVCFSKGKSLYELNMGEER
jgi:hypothetical protein